VFIHVETSCSCNHVYSNTLELHTQHTQDQERFFLVNSIEDTYIFFLYVSAVSQSITHLIDVITINILIIHSDKSWEINVQQWHILLDDEMLTNHVHLNIDIHVNLHFCLLISLNYMLFIYKSLYEENFLFFLDDLKRSSRACLFSKSWNDSYVTLNQWILDLHQILLIYSWSFYLYNQ